MAHDLQAAGATQIDLAERYERKSQRGRPEGISGAFGTEGPGDRARAREYGDRHDRTDCCGNTRRPSHDGSDAAGLAPADVDGDTPDCRHVHPEARGRPRDESELGGQGDSPQRAGTQDTGD